MSFNFLLMKVLKVCFDEFIIFGCLFGGVFEKGVFVFDCLEMVFV